MRFSKHAENDAFASDAPRVNAGACGELLTGHSSWSATMERRVVSYRDAYHGDAFAQFTGYPGARVVSPHRDLAVQSDLAFQRPLNSKLRRVLREELDSA